MTQIIILGSEIVYISLQTFHKEIQGSLKQHCFCCAISYSHHYRSLYWPPTVNTDPWFIMCRQIQFSQNISPQWASENIWPWCSRKYLKQDAWAEAWLVQRFLDSALFQLNYVPETTIQHLTLPTLAWNVMNSTHSLDSQPFWFRAPTI